MDGTYFTALAAIALAASSCKGPAPPSPAELAKSAAKARAAASQNAPPAPAQAPAAKPVLTLQEFAPELPSALCSPARGGSCALDRVGKTEPQDVTVVKRDEEALLIGWAADGEGGTVPPVVLLQLGQPGEPKAEDKKAPAAKAPAAKAPAGKALFAPAVRITKRTDVADALKNPAFVDAGYDLLASFKNVPAGEYTVSVVQVTAAGKALVCDTRRRLKIE